MLDFDKWQGLWRFERSVKEHARYVRDRDCEEFLKAVLTTAGKRQQTLSAGSTFWRAQVGNGWARDPRIPPEHYFRGVDDDPVPYPAKRMKPLKDRATEGRANPKGIPYLYVATEPKTAVAETRPWPHSFVSVATFKTTRELRVVNCTRLARRPATVTVGGAPPPIEWERNVWHRIDRAFSRPVTPSDDFADYAPTQIIAELFKVHGFDGIAYRSSLGPGHNLVFFDPNVARPVQGFIYAVSGVRYRIKQKGDSPCCFRYYNKKARRNPK